MVMIEHPSEGEAQMDSTRRLWIAGCALLVVGVVASAVGQVSLWREMDAVDAAGPGGPAGTLLGFSGFTAILGAVLVVAGIVAVIVAVTRTVRAGR